MNQRSLVRLSLLGTAAAMTAVFAYAASESSITVTEQRYNLDKRIQADVMSVLANNPELSGKVGVESHDQVVNLSGYLATPGQVWRAARDASQVRDVRYVVNEIRPLVGTVSY
jgi:osmotically-inducible protein OsmY